MWSTRNYKCLRVLEGHDSRVSGIDFMADKVGVVSCSHDKTWKKWSNDVLSADVFVWILVREFHPTTQTRKGQSVKATVVCRLHSIRLFL